ncbi:MAG TPA: hypothetical protein VGF23_25180 [Gaiellaceae bacterium]|jgi:hypothetical protein
MEYVSPFDDTAREPVVAAPRPPSLDGKRVALLDISKARGSEFLDRLEELLQARGAETFRLSKPTFSRPAPAEVVERIALHADLAVEALAD